MGNNIYIQVRGANRVSYGKPIYIFEQYLLNFNQIYSGEYLPEGPNGYIEFPLLYYKWYKFAG